MRLLDTLIRKRDFHLAQAGRFSDLIALMETDEDIHKKLHKDAHAIVNGAKAHFDAKVKAPVKRKTAHQTVKFRKAAARRMKLLWKKQRSVMMAGVKKGASNAHKARTATT